MRNVASKVSGAKILWEYQLCAAAICLISLPLPILPILYLFPFLGLEERRHVLASWHELEAEEERKLEAHPCVPECSVRSQRIITALLARTCQDRKLNA